MKSPIESLPTWPWRFLGGTPLLPVPISEPIVSGNPDFAAFGEPDVPGSARQGRSRLFFVGDVERLDSASVEALSCSFC